MPVEISTSDRDFASAFAAFLASKRETSEDVDMAVRGIIAEVRARGDAALIELTRKFDRLDLAKSGIRVSEAEIKAAYSACERQALDALELARDRIETYHRRQLPRDDQFTDDTGATLGSCWSAIEAVGLYVPGGQASYPSSVLMNAVPARVAGVPRTAMAVPAPDGEINPLVLAAAHMAGVTEIYRIGGAQAVAALAYGTETIAAVAKIVGPGNAYVAAAKRQVYGVVGIDSIAGPSEVLIIADKDNDPEWLAADLLAQAEHDTAAQSILMTDSAELAKPGRCSGRAAARQPAARQHRRRQLGDVRRRHPAQIAGGSAGARQPHRRRACGDRHGGATAPGGANPQCWRHLLGQPHAGGHRRLRGGLQSRAADGTQRALLLRVGRARFHEAHFHPAAGPHRTGAAGPGCDGTRPRRGSGGASPLGRHTPGIWGQILSGAMFEPPVDPNSKSKLVAINLDTASIGRANANIEHEREVAIFDILESNKFELEGRDDGPYVLNLAVVEDRLVFAVAQESGGETFTVVLSLTPLRRVMKDYFLVCESYYQAIRSAPPSRIQSIDMGRRALHNEGSQVLVERLKGKITVDGDTARRLFTLICALHWKG